MRERLAALVLVAIAACAAPFSWGKAEVVEPGSSARVETIAVTMKGFVPGQVDVHRGEAVTLVFTRQVERTCVKRVILALDGERKIERDLPRGQPVAITLRFDRAGEIGFSCPMEMHGGRVLIHDDP